MVVVETLHCAQGDTFAVMLSALTEHPAGGTLYVGAVLRHFDRLSAGRLSNRPSRSDLRDGRKLVPSRDGS